jgi:D-alanyl-D-alanine carboxypeptidase/D-alanyl-D-alanine-endopeptidase (penicillin-binding protein 4)
VAAKAGTSVAVDSITGRLYSKVQSLGGYLTLEDGRIVVFGLSVNGGTFPSLYEGLSRSGVTWPAVAAAFQQALS